VQRFSQAFGRNLRLRRIGAPQVMIETAFVRRLGRLLQTVVSPCAVGENRTPTALLPPEPESGASTSSATTALRRSNIENGDGKVKGGSEIAWSGPGCGARLRDLGAERDAPLQLPPRSARGESRSIGGVPWSKKAGSSPARSAVE
jgi:hypothetical protein